VFEQRLLTLGFVPSSKVRRIHASVAHPERVNITDTGPGSFHLELASTNATIMLRESDSTFLSP